MDLQAGVYTLSSRPNSPLHAAVYFNHRHSVQVMWQVSASLNSNGVRAKLDNTYSNAAAMVKLDSDIDNWFVQTLYNQTSNVTSVIEVHSASARLFAGTWCPLVSVITTFYYVAIIFHSRVWYRALSLRYARIIIIP